MDQFKSREEFIQGIVSLLSLRQNSEVLLIVASKEAGIETLQSAGNFISAFGLLAATEKLFDQRYREAMQNPEVKEADAERAKMVTNLMMNGDGSVN